MSSEGGIGFAEVPLSAAAAASLTTSWATVVFLDVPAGAEVGIDCAVWRVGAAFRGFRSVPPGAHSLHCTQTSSQPSQRAPAAPTLPAPSASDGGVALGSSVPRAGFWAYLHPGSVLVRRWSPAAARLEPPSDARDAARIAAAVRGGADVPLLRGLAPYPLDRIAQWLALTGWVAPRVVAVGTVDAATVTATATTTAAAKTATAAGGVTSATASAPALTAVTTTDATNGCESAVMSVATSQSTAEAVSAADSAATNTPVTPPAAADSTAAVASSMTATPVLQRRATRYERAERARLDFLAQRDAEYRFTPVPAPEAAAAAMLGPDWATKPLQVLEDDQHSAASTHEASASTSSSASAPAPAVAATSRVSVAESAERRSWIHHDSSLRLVALLQGGLTSARYGDPQSSSLCLQQQHQQSSQQQSQKQEPQSCEFACACSWGVDTVCRGVSTPLDVCVDGHWRPEGSAAFEQAREKEIRAMLARQSKLLQQQQQQGSKHAPSQAQLRVVSRSRWYSAHFLAHLERILPLLTLCIRAYAPSLVAPVSHASAVSNASTTTTSSSKSSSTHTVGGLTFGESLLALLEPLTATPLHVLAAALPQWLLALLTVADDAAAAFYALESLSADSTTHAAHGHSAHGQDSARSDPPPAPTALTVSQPSLQPLSPLLLLDWAWAVGEGQLAFAAMLVGESYEGYDHWGALVELIASAEAAVAGSDSTVNPNSNIRNNRAVVNSVTKPSASSSNGGVVADDLAALARLMCSNAPTDTNSGLTHNSTSTLDSHETSTRSVAARSTVTALHALRITSPALLRSLLSPRSARALLCALLPMVAAQLTVLPTDWFVDSLATDNAPAVAAAAAAGARAGTGAGAVRAITPASSASAAYHSEAVVCGDEEEGAGGGFVLEALRGMRAVAAAAAAAAAAASTATATATAAAANDEYVNDGEFEEECSGGLARSELVTVAWGDVAAALWQRFGVDLREFVAVDTGDGGADIISGINRANASAHTKSRVIEDKGAVSSNQGVSKDSKSSIAVDAADDAGDDDDDALSDNDDDYDGYIPDFEKIDVPEQLNTKARLSTRSFGNNHANSGISNALSTSGTNTNVSHKQASAGASDHSVGSTVAEWKQLQQQRQRRARGFAASTATATATTGRESTGTATGSATVSKTKAPDTNSSLLTFHSDSE